ncbi:MAG: T9SS type A sorting domain-containing protein [Bacteroidales bacterium]|nr:T9SS type A sorting domain-containing protein [Bacteroidales bacterium]
MHSLYTFFVLCYFALFSSLNLLAQLAMPDSVCIGDFKRYNLDSNLISGSTYAWEIDGVMQPGSANHIYITWDYSGTYMLEVQELSLGGCLGPVVSGQIFVSALPVISVEPTNQTACTGISASFHITVIGSGLTYQWRRGTVNLSNGGNISGATSPTLTIYPVGVADAATDYNVLVSGPCLPALISSYVSLTINPLGIDFFDIVNLGNTVRIYPNPFGAVLNLVIHDGSPLIACDIVLFNVLGEEIMAAKISKQLTTLEMSKLPAGIYFYRVVVKGYIIQTGRLISQY